MEDLNLITPEYLQKIWDNKRVRQRLAYESPLWFALLYLHHHFTHPLAPFHMEMFHMVENPEYNFTVVMAFRESGKSTIMNLGNVLWSILGKPQKKLAVIMSQTQEQAKNHFANIKAELEENELLREDFGPFTENTSEWNRLSLELEYHGAKIMSITRDQKVRGLKHHQYRPDLIICDDVEDSASIKDEKSSADFAKRFESEILPLGNENTKVIILGNLLCHYGLYHDADKSFILGLQHAIEQRKINGMFRAYPLIDDGGKNLWPGRFPNRQALLKLRMRFSLDTWIQEYLIKAYSQDNRNGPNINFLDHWHVQQLAEAHPGIFDRERQPQQESLIPQMEEFAIRAPEHAVHAFQNLDDPAYLKFLNDMCFYPSKEEIGRRVAEDRERYDP